MAADPALTHVPVILHSSAEESDVDWRACGAEAFLPKPFRIRDLPELLRRHLSARPAETRPRARPLTDKEAREVAAQIRQAIRHPGQANPQVGILSQFQELSPQDEARVEAVLIELLQMKEPGDGGEPPGGSGSPKGKPRRQRGDDADQA